MNTLSKLFLFYFFLFVATNFAQNITFKGIILDSISKPISGASIIISYDKDESNILVYSTSNNNGEFLLNFEKNTKHNEFWVSFRHLSYEIKKYNYKNESQDLKIFLKERSNFLNEVILKAKKNIEIRGDTISYIVDGIKKEKDYTIEEVINRIPGVEIKENGQISYNNRIISHLYINGVDLLEGRYNIATKGIPADAVEEINIMKKHNHARIDKGITDSEDVAFNLKIKKNHSLIFGTGKAEIGTPILQRNLEVTPIYLKDNFQDIASGKTNNIGNSLQNNGVNLTPSSRDFSVLESEKINILNEPNINGSILSNKYWLDNNAISVTNDALIKTGKDLIFKAGINYNLNDNALINTSTQSYFVDNDTILVNSNAKNELRKENFYTGLVQEINKNELYLKNKFVFETENSKGISKIIQNENALDYFYEDQMKSIKNLTEFKTKINKRIINSGLLLNFIESTEKIEVFPSVFNNEIPSNNNAEQTNQSINTSQFSIGGYSAYNFDIGKLKSEITQKVNWSVESLKSNLAHSENFIEQELQFPFKSDFKLSTFESNSSLESNFSLKKIKFTLNPSLNYTNLQLQENLSPSLNKKTSYFFLQPKAKLNYRIDHQWYLTLSGNYLTTISRFPQLFNGLVLKDYRSIYRNPEKINVTKSGIGIFNIGYTSILKGFLFSNSSSFSESVSDFIISSSIDDNGLMQSEAINSPNKRVNFNNTTNLTKSFFRILKTDFKYKFDKIISNQIFNSIEQNANSLNHTLEIDINLDNNTWYGFKYNGIVRLSNISANGFSTSNKFLKHNLEIDFYTSSKTRINFETESVFTSFSSSDINNKNSLFNMSFFYKPSKKLFFSASLNNIFNEQFFSTIESSTNFVSEYKFSLRPRQFTVGLNFSF